jgi:mono/diheme cytochrome c family protein
MLVQNIVGAACVVFLAGIGVCSPAIAADPSGGAGGGGAQADSTAPVKPEVEIGGWRAPADARKVANPVQPNAVSLANGRAAYDESCARCHGPKGHGDGKSSKQLSTKPADLAKRLVLQSDGEIFWKISQGKKPMPGFAKDLPPDTRWNLVNYIRHLLLPKVMPDSAKSSGSAGGAGSGGGGK